MTSTTKTKRTTEVNMARVDSQLETKFPLPGDTLADLSDAFNYYDKEAQGYITMPQFKNILQNFGFHAKQLKDQQEELRKNDPDILRRTGIDENACRAFIGYRWAKGGKQEEAGECFKLFDKKDRGIINAGDLKGVLNNYLDFPVTQQDIEDFIAMCGDDGHGNVKLSEFQNFYLSNP